MNPTFGLGLNPPKCYKLKKIRQKNKPRLIDGQIVWGKTRDKDGKLSILKEKKKPRRQTFKQYLHFAS